MGTNYSANSHDNDQRGLIYQEVVAEYFKELTGEEAIVKDSHGVDVECGKYHFEVKGTKSLYQPCKDKKTKRKFLSVRGWKTRPEDCPDSITHFAFVLDETHLSSKPIIYVVEIAYIRERFMEYPDSVYVRFPLHWVWDHYNYKLSRIP